MNKPAKIVSVAGVVGLLASIAAILDYVGIGPQIFGFPGKPEVVLPAGPAPFDQTKPPVNIGPQPKAGTEIPSSISAAPALAPVAPAPAAPKLTVELQGADLAAYDGSHYNAVLRFKITNTTENELKAIWLYPEGLITFKAEGGAAFIAPNSTLRKIQPTGLNICDSPKGPLCWERIPADFTTIAPGETVRAVVTVRQYIPRAQRRPFPLEIPGTFGAKLYVVDTTTMSHATQDISQDVTLKNPNGL